MQDAFSVPSRPASFPNVSRGRRLPGAMSTSPAIGRMAHPVDPPLPPVDRAAWRIRAHAGASPAATPPYSRIAQLRFGTWASASTSYGCRARTGLPPACWSPSLSGWLPTTPPQGGSNMAATIAPAPKRHQRNPLITLAAAALKADLAPRHYRIPPPDDMPPEALSAASGRRPVVTGRCASDRDHRLVGAGHLHVGPAGVRRPREAPVTLDGYQPHQRRAAGTVRPRRHDAAVGHRLVEIDGRCRPPPRAAPARRRQRARRTSLGRTPLPAAAGPLKPPIRCYQRTVALSRTPWSPAPTRSRFAPPRHRNVAPRRTSSTS